MVNLTAKTIGLFSKKTKDRILKESLLLFNEQTFNSTTTASIAKSSEVLEGSLWYHFKFKKDLLFEHINLFELSFRKDLENLKDGNKKNVIEKLLSIYGIVWDFRYIFRDSFESYEKDDKKVAESIKKTNDLLDNMVDDILVYCCDIKIFEIDQTDLKELSELILIIGKHWLDYSKKKYPSDSTDLLQKKGINLLIKVIYPYLTKDSKKIMDSIYAPV
jgi:AcrR family transcriptional regulator|tara:strand:- start:243 stop:896 length:654 start_codon:yes stop_codon:yes gene_type:complete